TGECGPLPVFWAGDRSQAEIELGVDAECRGVHSVTAGEVHPDLSCGEDGEEPIATIGLRGCGNVPALIEVLHELQRILSGLVVEVETAVLGDYLLALRPDHRCEGVGK